MHPKSEVSSHAFHRGRIGVRVLFDPIHSASSRLIPIESPERQLAPELFIPPFAERCQGSAISAWDASYDHPFVAGLIDGSLSAERFRFYQMQDARYLEKYADVCSLLSTRFRNPIDKLWFIDGAKLALIVEQELHTSYGKELGYSAEDIAALALTPNNAAYQNHMWSCAFGGSLLEGLAALAPCPWLYTDIGLRIQREMGDIPLDHPYRNWLMTYADPSFIAYTNQLLVLLQGQAELHGALYHNAAIKAFERSVQYEWMFWDQAWEMQTWSV